MYAIFKINGVQYKAKSGSVVCLNKISGDIGSTIEIKKIMALFNDEKIIFGQPFIKNSRIIATIKKHINGKKISIVKFSRRKHFKKITGYRQKLTNIKIIDICC
ncbi:rplU [Wigglesworthia glossinidia endosymbiont of Glossina brevipalpis]|uniref:Large ribosomal subunit protein bL21 n=1 Tax=Wigglesworthia glossinidia brevipalpis TaxID=36870 RepID=RL21_WIGBR|nr:RecName: Full=Large ribosomal subunit protein bL21; AltName: Full=50S ribosomal protein L21 [Wigglesworthia glossinidia endosymbiont of Glossina brevipalpis]BAC24623.1 rplU [Wigglesworthia glossinidia endosymbiont of Glossina brevipalpis]